MIELHNHLSDFEAPDFEKWQAAIEKELKGKPLNELSYGIAEAIQIPVALQDSQGPCLEISDAKSQRNNWVITELFFENDDQFRQKIINALEYGTEAPFIIGQDQSLNEKSLQGVFTDYIQPFLVQYPLSDFREIVNILLKHRSEEKPLTGGFLPMINSEADLKMLMQKYCEVERGLLDENFKLIHIAPYIRSSESNALAQINAILDRLKITFKALGPEAGKHILITLPIGDALLAEIAKIRALRVLIENLFQAIFGEHVGTSGVSILVWNDLDSYESEPNTNRIRASLQAWSAINGGADYLMIFPGELNPNADDPAFNRRIARNIHHIYRDESYLHWVSDPMHGSYHIELMSRKLAEEAWNNWVTKQEYDHKQTFPLATRIQKEQIGCF